MTLLHVNTYAIIVFACFALASLIHRTMFLLSHVCSYTLDHVELELEEPTKQAQAKDLANLALHQGKPRCI
jgi:hypothetical protein